MTELYWRAMGPVDAPTVVFCHGLFGQGKNWGTVAKALADQYRCVLVDMPNHGRSPWVDVVDYDAMAAQVADVLATLPTPAALVGHSMGGKIAMLVALQRPELVERLAVVDMSPVAFDLTEFTSIYAGLNGVDLAHLQQRGEADEALASHIPDPTVRAFLLQNLRHTLHPAEGEHHWAWQMNLAALSSQRSALGGWPQLDGTYDGPTLWIAGELSGYVREEHADAMRRLFPRVRKVTIKGAGHWVHSEQPDAFIATLRAFLSA